MYEESRIIPVGKTTISRWISNFVAENTKCRVKSNRPCVSSQASASETSNIKSLQEEIARLRKELASESLRADAYNELINVAEKHFNISIRKKAGAKQ